KRKIHLNQKEGQSKIKLTFSSFIGYEVIAILKLGIYKSKKLTIKKWISSIIAATEIKYV
ncbi:hypothetical protein, partial [Xanthovirga aplysinae]|uniref:hypothetical protein n=1 Tax=Xanthovirga aplysinae TaxID=2529853 RepID=UPI001CA3FD73